MSAAEGAGPSVVVRGDRSAVSIDDDHDTTKLTSLIHLELGDKSESIEAVIIELDAKGIAMVILARADGTATKGIIDLSARTAGSDINRTIALFVGELSRQEASASPPPSSPTPASPVVVDRPPSPPPPPPPPPKPTDKQNRARLFVGAGPRVIGIGQTGGNAVVSSPMAGASLGIGERTRVGALARVGFTSANDPLGKISALLLGVGLDAAYRAYVSTDRTVKIDTGPRVIASFIQGEGNITPRDTSQSIIRKESSALGIDLAWFVDATMIVSRPFFLGLGLEGGWLTPGLDLRADNRKVLQVSGASLGATLLIGVDFEPR